jgi:proline dehydrogenase
LAWWQEGMIRLARSATLTGFIQRRDWASGLAARFIGGPDVAAATRQALDLRAGGVGASLFCLGEYVEDPQAVQAIVGRVAQAMAAQHAAGLDVHASVDPTQLGLLISRQRCEENVLRLAQTLAGLCQPEARRGHDVLMLDMADAGATDATLDLHDLLRGQGLPVAVTVQAYLHRTEADLARLVESGAWVRLVKGALAEPEPVAARRRAEIDLRYVRGVCALLAPAARLAGCYPSFATHDERLIGIVLDTAWRQGWGRDEFEFEMLYGVRPDLQRALAARGYRVRAYLPFGTDWFPYTIRRVGESPRNLRFAVRALASAGAAGTVGAAAGPVPGGGAAGPVPAAGAAGPAGSPPDPGGAPDSAGAV